MSLDIFLEMFQETCDEIGIQLPFHLNNPPPLPKTRLEAIQLLESWNMKDRLFPVGMDLRVSDLVGPDMQHFVETCEITLVPETFKKMGYSEKESYTIFGYVLSHGLGVN